MVVEEKRWRKGGREEEGKKGRSEKGSEEEGLD